MLDRPQSSFCHTTRYALSALTLVFPIGESDLFGVSEMRSIVAMFIVVLPTAVRAQDVRPHQPTGVEAAIDRGLGFLVKDALAWKNEHKCASCHHAGLVVWA